MKKILFLMLVSMGFILTGCEKHSSYTKKIINHSDYEIMIATHPCQKIEARAVAPGEEFVLYQSRVVEAELISCIPMNRPRYIRDKDGVDLQKSLLEEDNWEMSLNEAEQVNQVCSFIITNKDFEEIDFKK